MRETHSYTKSLEFSSAELPPAPSEADPMTVEEKEEAVSSSLTRNMLILGVVVFALLAGMTILMRKKQ